MPVNPKANELALNRKLRSMYAYSEEVVNHGNYVFFTALSLRYVLLDTPQDEFAV